MNKQEWCGLPASMIAELLWPILGGKLQDIEAPKIPLSPQWDMRLRRKGGLYIWASECDLGSLQFYFKRSQQAGDPAFAEKNKKESDSLGYWVRWRQAFPTAIWSGTRGKKGDPSVTAKAPAAKPSEYAWEERGGSGSSIPRSDTTSTAKGYVEESYGPGSDDGIPF